MAHPMDKCVVCEKDASYYEANKATYESCLSGKTFTKVYGFTPLCDEHKPKRI